MGYEFCNRLDVAPKWFYIAHPLSLECHTSRTLLQSIESKPTIPNIVPYFKRAWYLVACCCHLKRLGRSPVTFLHTYPNPGKLRNRQPHICIYELALVSRYWSRYPGMQIMCLPLSRMVHIQHTKLVEHHGSASGDAEDSPNVETTITTTASFWNISLPEIGYIIKRFIFNLLIKKIGTSHNSLPDFEYSPIPTVSSYGYSNKRVLEILPSLLIHPLIRLWSIQR